MIQFMVESPWLTFFLALFAGQCVVAIFSRLLRTINVVVRGMATVTP